jgi:C4-dicarboxylate-specific signal transduction histidine kinase
MVSAPTMYSELIKRELHNHPDANVKEWLENLNRDLDQLQRFVREVNQLSVAREQREESFAVSEIVESARVVLETKLDGITLRRDGDLLIHADRNRMLRILLNVISNASDAISASKPAVPEIVVKSSGNTIAIHDNGGGFDVATLAKIEKRGPVSSKSSGGLGMLIMRDYVDELGGTVRFYNDGAGAVVEVMIPTQRINAEMPRA